MENRRVLILGGCGYIGRTLLQLYATHNADIVVVDRQFIPAVVDDCSRCGATFIQGDIGDLALMRRLIVDEPCSICYLLAGQVEAETSLARTQEMWTENYDKAAGVMELCQPHTRLFFPSSANVFGGNADSPDTVYTEDDDPQPLYPYAETKAAMEALLAEWGGNYVCARLGTNYGWGPGIRFNLVVNLFTKLALQGQQLCVHGDGSNYRPFVHNYDCARAVMFLGECGAARGKIYHVVEGNHQIQTVAETVSAVVGGQREPRYVAFRRGFSSYQMSSQPIKDLGFNFQLTLSSGIRDLADHLKSL